MGDEKRLRQSHNIECVLKRKIRKRKIRERERKDKKEKEKEKEKEKKKEKERNHFSLLIQDKKMLLRAAPPFFLGDFHLSVF